MLAKARPVCSVMILCVLGVHSCRCDAVTAARTETAILQLQMCELVASLQVSDINVRQHAVAMAVAIETQENSLSAGRPQQTAAGRCGGQDGILLLAMLHMSVRRRPADC